LALLIQNIHCGDIVEKWEINEFRCKMLSKVETIFRTILKKLHFEEQLEQHILTKSKEDTIAFAKQNGVVDADFDGYF
jgi:golgin subfamily B member 1